MSQLYGEQLPPSYTEATGQSAPTIVVERCIVIDVEQQPRRQPKVRQNTTINRTVVGVKNASNSFSGFLDVLYEQQKLPSGSVKRMIYAIGLAVYYIANFIYSIVAVAVQRENLAYHLVYIIISLIGVLFVIIAIIVYVREQFTESREMGSTNQVTSTDQPRQAWTAETQADNYPDKAKNVFVDYVLLSLLELLIYPILMCNLYGVINERAWQFDNGISGCNFLFFLYSVIMDALYMKVYVTWLVIRAVNALYVKYDELLHPRVEWKRYFTPVYLTIPLAVVTALTHWLMTAIIGVRIYIDNFTPDKEDTDSSIPNTGDYRVLPLTGYMIACTIWLPIVSWITYIILNKPWFYEVYSAIHQLNNGADRMPEQDTWNKKLFAFIKDPLAYFSVVLLMAPFIVFTVATYLPEYNSSDYEVASSARNALQALGPCYIAFFLLANLQAAIIGIIVTLMIASVVLCIVAVICIVLGFICSLCGES